jgi:phosphohistidine phosphatase
MRTLLLLRHATARAPDPGRADRDRALSDHGIAQARALGAVMRLRGFVPDAVLCSPAVRTRQTLGAALPDLEAHAAAFPPGLYGASAGDLLHAVQTLGDDAAGCLLLIAHNPGVHLLARMLADPHSAEYARLGDYMPGTLTALTCPAARWAELTPGESAVAAILVSGRDYAP